MCSVSMVGDYWNKKLPEHHPWTQPYTIPNNPLPTNPGGGAVGPFVGGSTIGPTREEFEALKREIIELKELLKAAQKFDATNQPHCEHEEKIALIKKFAEYVGVEMSDVFK